MFSLSFLDLTLEIRLCRFSFSSSIHQHQLSSLNTRPFGCDDHSKRKFSSCLYLMSFPSNLRFVSMFGLFGFHSQELWFGTPTATRIERIKQNDWLNINVKREWYTLNFCHNRLPNCNSWYYSTHLQFVDLQGLIRVISLLRSHNVPNLSVVLQQPKVSTHVKLTTFCKCLVILSCKEGACFLIVHENWTNFTMSTHEQPHVFVIMREFS